MKWRISFTLVVFLLTLVTRLPEAQASKIRLYDFVEFSTKSDLIVVAESVQRNGEQLSVVTKEYVQGNGPKQLKVAFIPEGWHAEADKPMAGERLVFLTRQDNSISLFGEGLQAIWPQSGNGSMIYPYASAKDVKALATLALQVRSSIMLSSEKRQDMMEKMVGSPDPFVKLVGFQLCDYLYSLDREKYKDEFTIGAAYAVRDLDERDRSIYYAALQLAMIAPKSVALPNFLAAMKQANEPAKQNAAFIRFTQISGTRGMFDFQANTSTPDPKVRAAGYAATASWLEKKRPILITADSKTILDALKADEPKRRMVGKIWLQVIAGEDFGYKETGSMEQRAEALKKIEAWFQKVQSEAARLQN